MAQPEERRTTSERRTPSEPRTPSGPSAAREASDGPEASTARDWTDEHVARWQPVLPDLDPVVEGAVTRMKKLSVHLRRVREQSLADFDLERHEFDTLHKIAGRGGSAAPSELAQDLDLAPASVSGRLDALEKRGFVRRTQSTTDRRRVVVELTAAGHETWLGAMDVLGHEEYRLLGVLSPEERALLNGMLRRVMVEAESAEPTRHW
ncbi:MarR family transcriptional regulator [Streptomyces sp. NPDC006553]|uniref:MarR family winged helix-turn-helix transcriptional regulator n=1 Tax=unclassified Streptomyces TaxID=2593676 RepID=UPI002250D15F|nr:MarR family transcriptional regulator [Streptomyces sp. NBC_00233]MCX5228205.1 MarR family transcriptional regulator [Streptomyces sp. NBC_00233]